MLLPNRARESIRPYAPFARPTKLDPAEASGRPQRERRPRRRPGQGARAASLAAAGVASLFALGGCAAVLGIDEVDLAVDEGAAGASGMGEGGSTSGGPGVGGAGGLGDPGLGGGRCGRDKYEPNNTRVAAKEAPANALEPCKTVQLEGVSGPDDEDWFTINDAVGCLTAPPQAKLLVASSGSGSGPAAVCYFVRADANLSLGCARGTASVDLPGFQGCCGDDEVAFEKAAAGARGQFLLRVGSRPGADACFNYTLQFSL
jgi:hypothetical protein